MLYYILNAHPQSFSFKGEEIKTKRKPYRYTLSIFLLCTQLSFSLSAQENTISIRDKIGQMLMFGFTGLAVSDKSDVVKWIDQSNLGGVILFDIDLTKKKGVKNIQSKQQISALTKQLQVYTHQSDKKHHRPTLPLLIAIDYEGGWVDRLKTAEGFEPSISPGDFKLLTDKKLKYELNKMSSNLKAAGFNLDFAPIVDVQVNSTNPIISTFKRSYSSDPIEVVYFAELFMNALLINNIQCALKHFPGHGSSKQDSHLNSVDTTNTWQSYELLPYQKLILNKPSCGVVMAAHLANRQLDPSGLPATLSHKMLTDLLRHHLHFEGVIITDDMQMKAISDHFSLKQAVTLAINAGVDILLFANQIESVQIEPKKLIDIIELQVKSGKISEQRIDEAYQHIVNLKRTLTRSPD